MGIIKQVLFVIAFIILCIMMFRRWGPGYIYGEENVICLGFLKKLDHFNENYRDPEHEGDPMNITSGDIKMMERAYACGCSESSGVNLNPENRPENKKSKWMSPGGVVVEQTYKEEYSDICNDLNKCKIENRPLERCANDDSCRYTGMKCYKHPSFTNGGRTDVAADIKGVCILESNIHHLEEIVDTYNSAYCDPKSQAEGGGIDYMCLSTWDTRPGHEFLHTNRDILGRAVLGANDDVSVCYQPANEKRTVTSYDVDKREYVYGPGSECCVPKTVSDNNHQSDSLLLGLINNPMPFLDALGEMLYYELIEIAAKKGITTVISNRRVIMRAMKTSVSKTFKMLKGAKNLLKAENRAMELAKIIKSLASEFSEGLKALNEMRKAAQERVGQGTSRALERLVQRQGVAAAEELAEGGLGEAAAAGAEAAAERALAEAAAEKTAKKMSAKFLDAIPGFGEILMAVQMIGLVMDETGYGGYENIFKNREIIETMSEQSESQMLKMMKLMGSEPPYGVDLENTFYEDENEGSIWPFNMEQVQGSDKADCQLLVNMVSSLKESSNAVLQAMLTEQMRVFVTSFDDDEFSNSILGGLEALTGSEGGDENDLSDYFNEYLASYTHYHYTKEQAEERDQTIYDTILSKTNLINDPKYKSPTNTDFYYNDNALIYLNKELSSEEYSGILLTKKGVDLFNRYRNLRKGHQYIVFSTYFLDIGYIESNPDYPNGEQYHLKKLHVDSSRLVGGSKINLSSSNPIRVKGMAQLTQMNDLVNVCQYGIKLGTANYNHPGLNGMIRDRSVGMGVSGNELGTTWLVGGGAAVQPFGYPGLAGQESCRNGCREDYMSDTVSEENAKFRLENYNNRMMSWNYADKKDWQSLGQTDYKSSTLIAVSADHPGSHDEVVDHDNRICIINENYCRRAGNLDHRPDNEFGGDNSRTTNDYDQLFGNNHRKYADCEESGVHEAFSMILGDSLTNTVSRWFS
jgi:hypothetical protein